MQWITRALEPLFDKVVAGALLRLGISQKITERRYV